MGTRRDDSGWRADARQLLAQASAGGSSFAIRMRTVAAALLDSPYQTNPLGGGPEQAERLHIDLGQFDCVTYVECVLALARSASVDGFQNELRALRYREAQVGWSTRLHYFSDWLRANAKRGALSDSTKGPGARQIDVVLDLVPGLPRRTARIWVLPKRGLKQSLPRLHDGSVVAFASTRARLDYFHVGLLFWEEDQLHLFHAAKSVGGAIREPLQDFLDRNRMRGLTVAVARPPTRSRP